MIANNDGKSMKLADRVSEVLFYVWDPVGVCPNPSCRSEYEGYVEIISVYLAKEYSEDRLRQLMVYILEEYMAMPIDGNEKNQKTFDLVVELLIEWRDIVKEQSYADMIKYVNVEVSGEFVDQIKWSHEQAL